MGVFDRQRATAKRLIDKNGQLVQWQQRSAAGGTLAKPAGTVTAEHDVKIVFLPSKRELFKSFLAMLGGTEVPAGGLYALMWGGVPFKPLMKDTVKRVDDILSLVDQNGIEVIDPNGEGPILYLLRFTR